MQYDYQITWTGQSNQTLSLGGLSFLSGKPRYFTEGSLPLQLDVIKSITGISVVSGVFIDPLDGTLQGTTLAKALSGNPGIMFRGAASVKYVMVGLKRATLQRNVPNYDFNPSEAEYVIANYSDVEKV